MSKTWDQIASEMDEQYEPLRKVAEAARFLIDVSYVHPSDSDVFKAARDKLEAALFAAGETGDEGAKGRLLTSEDFWRVYRKVYRGAPEKNALIQSFATQLGFSPLPPEGGEGHG